MNDKFKKVIKMIIYILILLTICLLAYFRYSELKKEKESCIKSDEKENKSRDLIDDYGIIRLEKPVIYLYPEKEEKINIDFVKKELLTASYPKYNKEGDWSVIAKPNGKLWDLNNKKNLYCLYYEGIIPKPNYWKIEKEGFVVSGKNTSKFLEEKLKQLGLNDYEAQEMIIYWLPQLEKNKYNYIRFISQDEINKIYPLKFSKNPDSLIRIMMIFKKLDKEIEVKKQKLITPKRKGFTVVEWGGSEIK